MIRAVLFDLDGTLLDIDLHAFLSDYFSLLGPVLAGLVADGDAHAALGAVLAGTRAMSGAHPGATNEAVFVAKFEALTGVDILQPDNARVVLDFYEHIFPRLHGDHGPKPGAREVVGAAGALGLRRVLATNPIFPRAAVLERLRWAGLTADQFDLVTSYENSSACKPSPTYYKEIAESIDVAPADCLMVGDDAQLDLAAAAVGMKTFFVGTVGGPGADWRGSLGDLSRLLPRIAASAAQ